MYTFPMVQKPIIYIILNFSHVWNSVLGAVGDGERKGNEEVPEGKEPRRPEFFSQHPRSVWLHHATSLGTRQFICKVNRWA